MDHLAIPRAHIVGHAFGGTVNAKLLTIAADRYKTAILTASAGSRTWTALNEKAAEDEAVEITQSGPVRARVLRIAPREPPKTTEETIREQSRVMVSVNDPVALAALVRSRRELVVTNAQMAAVRVPTLAIVGGVDAALSGVNELKTIMPTLNLVVIQDAVHSADDPRSVQRRPEFVNAIRDFIGNHRMSTGP